MSKPQHLYDGWCDCRATNVASGRKLHTFTELPGGRSKIHGNIVETVLSHYEDPTSLAKRIKRFGYSKAASILHAMLPRTKKARSGHVGEILAAEAVPAILPSFQIPIKRLRWLDGRDTALRGEDVIGLEQGNKIVRFLKGESKSRRSLTPDVIAKARTALKTHRGRPSPHAMGFIMRRLREAGKEDLARVFEDHLLSKSIAKEHLVHLLFSFSGNDASAVLQDDLQAYSGDIEQHSVSFSVADHQRFIASIYKE